jgi:hypothetical protein
MSLISFFTYFLEGSPKAKICWKLDLSDSKLNVRSVELDVSSQEFESGQILWQLCGDNVCLLPKSGIKMLETDIISLKILIVLDEQLTKSFGHFEVIKVFVDCHEFLVVCRPKATILDKLLTIKDKV